VALSYSGQKAEAISELETAIHLDPTFVEAYSFLGTASRQNGDLERGRKYLDRAISLNPALPGPHVDDGLILLKTGQHKVAYEQFQWAANTDETGQIPDLEAAVAELQQAIKERAEDPLAFDTLGVLMGKAGNASELVI